MTKIDRVSPPYATLEKRYVPDETVTELICNGRTEPTSLERIHLMLAKAMGRRACHRPA